MNGFKFFENLLNNSTLKKVPYIKHQSDFIRNRTSPQIKDITILENNKTREKLVNCYQRGVDIKTEGRLKGNMHYVEDSWDIQIEPVSFKYAYLKNGTLTLGNTTEMKVRDKYIKIRVRYDGTQYAIINALRTLFTISYA